MKKESDAATESKIQYQAHQTRLDFLDLARFIAIFFMVLSHVQLMYSTLEFIESPLGLFFDIMAGPPAAPVFMFSMGFLMTYNKDLDQLKPQRGVKIFVAGVLLNLVRWVIPLLIGIAIGGDILSEYDETGIYWIFMLDLLFQVDILILAGLAYSIVVFTFRIDGRWLPVVLFFVIAFLAPELWGTITYVYPVDLFLNMLWGLSANTFFPVFPWLCYPILGAWIGTNYKTFKNEQRIDAGKVFLYIGLGLFTLGLMITATDIERHINDYYHSGPGAVILYSGFVILWILTLNRLVPRIRGKLKNGIRYVSTNLTSIYCIHWTILGWLLLLIPMNSINGFTTIIFFVILFAVSTYLSKFIRIKL